MTASTNQGQQVLEQAAAAAATAKATPAAATAATPATAKPAAKPTGKPAVAAKAPAAKAPAAKAPPAAPVEEQPMEPLIEETQFELPALLDATQNPAYANETQFTINLYATGCLDCSHLVAADEDHELVERSKCHFQNGNSSCPAQYFRIEFIGRKVKWQRKVDAVKALEPGSTDRSNAAIALVSQAAKIEDDTLRNSILQQLGV